MQVQASTANTADSQEHAAGNLPDWFIEAQRKAKRTGSDSKPVQRSRYADALEAAVTESSGYFQEANNAILTNAQERLAARADEIAVVAPPADAWEKAHGQSGADRRPSMGAPMGAAGAAAAGATAAAGAMGGFTAPAHQAAPDAAAPRSADPSSTIPMPTPAPYEAADDAASQQAAPASGNYERILPVDLEVPPSKATPSPRFRRF